VGPLAELGLATATSITALFNAALLVFGFRVSAGLPRDQELFTGLVPSVVLASLVGVGAWLTDGGVAGLVSDGRAGLAVRVGAAVAVGVLVFVGLAGRLCPREWRALVSRRSGAAASDPAGEQEPDEEPR
jgi:peptidoglycan biosynthesis protein MviN/MurJ (putative lipid II flippase)